MSNDSWTSYYTGCCSCSKAGRRDKRLSLL